VYFSIFIRMKRYLINSKLEMPENLRHPGFLIELWWRVVCACCVYFSIFIRMKRYLINSKLEMPENLRHSGFLIELLWINGIKNS
jgi:prolipoprotein diacylglyceryltransferase